MCSAEVRVQLQTASYIDRDARATKLFNETFNKEGNYENQKKRMDRERK